MFYPTRLILVASITLTACACSRPTEQAGPPAPEPVPAAAPAAPTAEPLPPGVTRRTTHERIVERAANTGGSATASGDKADLKDMKLATGSASAAGSGLNAGGGGLEGSVRGMVSGLGGIRLWAILGFFVCGGLAYWNFKKNPLDWHYWGGLALAAIGCVVIAANPELLIVGLIVAAVGIAPSILPSITGTRTVEAGKVYEDYLNKKGLRADFDAWRQSTEGTATGKDNPTIDFIRRNNP